MSDFRLKLKKILDPKYFDEHGNRFYPDDPFVDGDEEDNVGNGPGNPGNRIPTPPGNRDDDGPSREPGPPPPTNPDDPRYGKDYESDDNDHREDVYQDDWDGDGIINGKDDDFQDDQSGLFGGLFNGLGGLGIGNLIQSIIAKYTDATVTGGEQIRNQWDIDKMNMSNEFSAQQAEIARDWQEQMYQQYNSLSGRIQQAEEAGVNPMFAVNNGASVSPSSPSPSGAVASGSGRGAGGSGDLASMIASFVKLKSDVDLTKSQIRLNESKATGQNITNEQLRDMNVADILSKLSQVDLNNANINLIASKVLNTDADTQVKGAQLGQIASQIANTDADTKVKGAQLGLIASQIANTEADTKVKAQQIAVMLSEIVKNEKSLDVMDAQVQEMLSAVGVNHASASKLSQEFNNLVQTYDSNQMLRMARQLAEPDGSEGAFAKFMYKLVALLKK